jgi:hypothetical protein
MCIKHLFGLCVGTQVLCMSIMVISVIYMVLGELPRRCFVEYPRSIGLFLNPLTQSGEWIIIRQNFILALINGRDILARVKTRGEYRFFDDTWGQKKSGNLFFTLHIYIPRIIDITKSCNHFVLALN